MTNTIPAVVPPLQHDSSLNRQSAPAVAFHWLALGWRDLLIRPAASLLYGLTVLVVSAVVVVGLYAFGWDFILFPAFAGFMVVGPILAIGLYEKSRRLATGEPVSLTSMILVHPASWGAIVLGLFLVSLAAGLLGLIVVFPLLGHGTWHAYHAIRRVV